MDTAHAHGIYVILNIIFNHSGGVFAYDADRYFTGDGHGGHFMDPRWDNHPYRVKGYRNADGSPDIAFARIDKAAHPEA